MVSRLLKKRRFSELVNIARRSEPLIPTPPPGFQKPINTLKNDLIIYSV